MTTEDDERVCKVSEELFDRLVFRHRFRKTLSLEKALSGCGAQCGRLSLLPPSLLQSKLFFPSSWSLLPTFFFVSHSRQTKNVMRLAKFTTAGGDTTTRRILKDLDLKLEKARERERERERTGQSGRKGSTSCSNKLREEGRLGRTKPNSSAENRF